MTQTEQPQKERGSKLLRDMLESHYRLTEKRVEIESQMARLDGQLKLQQQQLNNLSAVMRDAAMPILEDLLGEIIANTPLWASRPNLVAQAVGVTDEWWKIFLLVADGDKLTQINPQQPPPGLFWSLDPERRLQGARSVGAHGRFVRWTGNLLPAVDASKGLLGSVLINPITGEFQLTQTEATPIATEERPPEETPPPPAQPQQG